MRYKGNKERASKISDKWNVVLLTIYLLIVWMSYIYVFITDNKTYVLLLVIFGGIIIYFTVDFIIVVLKKYDIREKEDVPVKRRGVIFGISSLICFLLMIIWYAGYYPGSFSTDSIYQYGQAINDSYNDWHPVWHTLVFFTFPLALTGKTESIILFQMAYFSLAIGYMGMIIYKYAGAKTFVVSIAYILLNPYVGYILLYPWKDVGFAIAGLLSMVMVVEIYFTHGEWADKWWRCVTLGLALANTTLFRHNAILFSAFIVIALWFHLKKKQWLKMFLVFAAMLIIVKGPVYYFLNVEQPGSRVVESVGLPLTIIGNVVKETPDALDEELSEFAYSIASQESWETNYVCGNFNSMKWQTDTNLEIVEEKGILTVYRLSLKCFQYSPRASFKALFALTDMVYGLENDIEGDVGSEITENSYGITYMGNESIAVFLQYYKVLLTQTIFKYFRHIGFSMLLMLLAVMAWSDLKSWEDWKKLFLCIPIFIYNFGTMLLLTGPDSRFFYISFLVCPLIIIVVMVKRRNIKNG